jgi:cation-transporting ATPase 13A1
MYRILAVNCLIYAYTLSVLYMDGIKLGDTQSMVQGLVISVFFYFLSTAEPLNKLSRHRPPNSIFQPAIMLSIFLQFLTHLAALILVVNMAQPFLIRGEDWVPDKEFKPDVLNTSVYLLNFWINVVNFLVNYQGEPFMVPLRENRKLYKFSTIALGVIVLGVFGAFDLDYYLELVQLPDTVVSIR